MNPTLLIPLSAIAYLLLSLLRRRKSLRFIQGPPVSSWLLGMFFIGSHIQQSPNGNWSGHEYELANQAEVGDLEFKWFRDYGTVFRSAGCCGVRSVSHMVLPAYTLTTHLLRLLFSSPKIIRKISWWYRTPRLYTISSIPVAIVTRRPETRSGSSSKLVEGDLLGHKVSKFPGIHRITSSLLHEKLNDLHRCW